MPDLWPPDIGSTRRRAPVDILREQATLLSEKTDGLVTADVNFLKVPRFEVGRVGGEFRFDFEILAPRLNHYSFTLFSTYNSSSLYPVRVEYDEFEGGSATAQSEKELMALLSEIFSSKATRDMISGIRAQIDW